MLGFYICILFSTALTLPLPFRTMQNIQQERKTTLVISKLFRSTVSFKITRKHRPCRYPILYYFFFMNTLLFLIATYYCKRKFYLCTVFNNSYKPERRHCPDFLPKTSLVHLHSVCLYHQLKKNPLICCKLTGLAI